VVVIPPHARHSVRALSNGRSIVVSYPLR
jgi:hypothetical protein